MIPPYEHTYITLKIVETALVPVYKNPLHPTTLTPPPAPRPARRFWLSMRKLI